MFWDPRLNDSTRLPHRRQGRFWQSSSENATSSRQSWQRSRRISWQSPVPRPAGMCRTPPEETERRCSTEKHVAPPVTSRPLYTEPGWNMHTPQEIGIDDFQANRSPDGRYRTTPLTGMIAKQKGGFYHDGRFATLLDTINHYDRHFNLRLSDEEKRDLAAFVSSL